MKKRASLTTTRRSAVTKWTKNNAWEMSHPSSTVGSGSRVREFLTAKHPSPREALTWSKSTGENGMKGWRSGRINRSSRLKSRRSVAAAAVSINVSNLDKGIFSLQITFSLQSIFRQSFCLFPLLCCTSCRPKVPVYLCLWVVMLLRKNQSVVILWK